MSRPHALLRVGFPYDRTLGMRRLTMTASDLAIGPDGHLFILGRGGFGITYVRHLTLDDEDVDGFNLIGFGPGAAGAERMVNGGRYVWPQSIVMGDDGNLWLSDEGAHQISAITTDGDLVSQWGEHGGGEGQLDRPSGIALDGDGNLLVVDTMNHRVQRFAKDGAHLGGFGEFGSGDGQFNMPWGIALDEVGDVYIADWRNDRVQKFTADGDFIFKFGVSATGTVSSTGPRASPSIGTATYTWSRGATAASSSSTRRGSSFRSSRATPPSPSRRRASCSRPPWACACAP